MADLVIAEAGVSDAAVLLRAAADPIRDAISLGSWVAGSGPVAAALDDVKLVLRRVMDALAEVADDAASDADEVGAAFDELDGQLSGDLP
jgi:phage-related minor tail protein